MALAGDREGGRSAAARALGRLVGAALACGLVFGAAPAFAQAACSRDDLQAVTDAYLAAQAVGDAIKIPMGLWVNYTEQKELASMNSGFLSQPHRIDFHRTLIDTTSCQTFTEAVINEPAHPYVIGTILQARGGQVGSIATLITDHDNGWLFDPAKTLAYSKAENWSVIPEAERDSRDTIIAAADAYLDSFNDKTVVVPWGSPCARLEGGAYTGKGAPGVVTAQDSCNVGVPSGVKLVDRAYVVDESLGAVAVMLTFGANSLADTHTFRVEHGKIRYVHTITVCKTFNCGFKLQPPPPAAG